MALPTLFAALLLAVQPTPGPRTSDALRAASELDRFCVDSSPGFANTRKLLREAGWRSALDDFETVDEADIREVLDAHWKHPDRHYVILLGGFRWIPEPHWGCSVSSSKFGMEELVAAAATLWGRTDDADKSKGGLSWRVRRVPVRYVIVARFSGEPERFGLAVVEYDPNKQASLPRGCRALPASLIAGTAP